MTVMGNVTDKAWFQQNLDAVKQTRKCQRNWDHSKTMPEQDIEYLVDVALNSPTKQDEAYFDLYVLTNREKIREMYLEHSWGFVVDDDVQYRNPQIGAHAVIFWARKIPDTNRNAWVDNSLKHSQPFSRMWTNCLTSIGISSGMVALTAAHMGYQTGYCKNHFQQPHSYDAWIELLGHREPCHPDADPNYKIGKSDPEWVCPHSGMDTTIIQSLGIGYADESLKWYQNRDTQYMTSHPDDKVTGEVDCFSMPGIVHDIDKDVIEFGPWSHDVNTGKSVDRPHNLKWIK